MLVSIALTVATACTVCACTKRLDKTQWPETRDETYWAETKTQDASVWDRDETKTLRILSKTRARWDVSTSRGRDISTKTTSL